MINLLLCGNRRVFDGALTQLISMTNRTKEPIHVFLMTMNLEEGAGGFPADYRGTGGISEPCDSGEESGKQGGNSGCDGAL